MGNMLVKVKGLKRKVSYWLLNWLLYNRRIEVRHTIWKRDFLNSTILVIDQGYTLEINSNKRKTIFDSCGKFVSTKPYQLEGDIIKNLFDEVLYYITEPLLALPWIPEFDVNYAPPPPPNLPSVIYLPSNSSIPDSVSFNNHLPQLLFPIIKSSICQPLDLPPLIYDLPVALSLANSVIQLEPPLYDSIHIKSLGACELRVYDCKTGLTSIYPSMARASKTLHICDKTIRRFIKHGSLARYQGRFIFYKVR